jgi:hypothetical protein
VRRKRVALHWELKDSLSPVQLDELIVVIYEKSLTTLD